MGADYIIYNHSVVTNRKILILPMYNRVYSMEVYKMPKLIRASKVDMDKFAAFLASQYAGQTLVGEQFQEAIDEARDRFRPVLGAVTDILEYVAARKQAEELAREHGLKVADLPLIARVVGGDEDFRSAVRPTWIDAVSSEVQGVQDGKDVYQMQHGAGDLSTVKGLETAIASGVGVYSFMRVGLLGKDGEVQIVPMEELRGGNVPSAGTPYAPTLIIPDGYQLIPLEADIEDVRRRHNAGELIIYEAGQLNFHQAELDDRFLAGAGSPENLALMIGVVSKEGYTTIGNYHRIGEVGFPAESRGRPVLCYNIMASTATTPIMMVASLG